MVYTMEALEVFASDLKTNMTATAPQDFVTIAIQNAEEELAQPLVKLLVLNKNVKVTTNVVVTLTVKKVDVFVHVHR